MSDHVTPLSLSSAIRLGAMAVPPVHGPVFKRSQGGICGACAIGAPIFALFGESAREELDSRGSSLTTIRQIFTEHWPWTVTRVTHPVRGSDSELVNAMVSLFETYFWTRERIADWIETLEAQQDTQAQPLPDLQEAT